MNYKYFTKIEIIMLKLIILLRRDLIGWKILTLLAYFLKLYGMFLISNCILINIDELQVSKYIRALTLFGSELSETNFFIKYYNVLFFIIISIAVIYIAAITLYLTSAEISVFDQIEKKETHLTKGMLALEKFISYSTFGFIFFSQHLIEFFSLSIVTQLNSLPTTPIADQQVALVQSHIANFSKSLLINAKIYLILSVLVIILINSIIFFYFNYLNEPLLNYDSSLKYSKMRHFPILITITANLQGVVLYDIILYQSSLNTFNLILTSLTFFLAILLLIKHYRSLIYFNAMKMSTIFTINYSIIACLVNVIYKYTFKNQEVNLSASKFLLKLLNEVIIAYGVTQLIAQYKIQANFNKLTQHLFKKNKRIKTEILLFLGEVMKSSVTNPKNLLKLAHAFSKHSFKCKNDDCDCKKMDLNKFYSTVNNMIKETSQVSLIKSLQMKIFAKNFSELICFIDCVIVNSISKIKTQDIANDSLILFHVDYVSYFKRCYLHSNYLICVYSNFLKLNFNDKVKFFVLKNNNFEKYNEDALHDHLCVKFYRHFKTIKKMKKLILSNCKNLNEVLIIRKTFKKSEAFRKSDKILELSQNITKIDKGLMKEITEYPECLRNSQFCYVINNYFSMTSRTEIPKKILDMLSFYNITKFDADFVANQEYSYPEMNMMYPIIVSIKENEHFLIKYACSEICEKLNYKKEDLIGQDINIFLPHIMERPHKICLKNKILIQKLYQIKKKAFIKSHDNYYVPAKFYSSFSTNFSGEIEIIINIKLKESKEKKHNKYYFLIDHQFNILSHSKNFEENYFNSSSQIEKTELNFISMFNLNYEKIIKRFQSKIDLISSIQIENAYNLVSIFQSVDFTPDKPNLKNFAEEKVFIKIPKTKLTPTLEKIKLFLEEYDSEEKVEIKKLEQIIQEFNVIKRLMGSAEKNNSFLKGKSVKKILSTDNDYEKGNNFLFKLELKQIGDLHFYYGKLYEKNSSYGIHNTTENRTVINQSFHSFNQLPGKRENITKDDGIFFTKHSLVGKNLLDSEMNFDDKLAITNSYTDLHTSSANLMTKFKFNGKNNNKNKLKSIASLDKNKTTDNIKKDPGILLSKSLFRRLNEKFIFSTLILFLLFHVGFFLYVFDYSHYILTESENIFFVNYYSLSLKSAVYYDSGALMSACMVADMKSKNISLEDFPLSYDLIRTKLKARLIDTLVYYQGINNYLGKVEKEVDNIYNILNKQDEYNLIYEDWSQYSRQSTIENELIYFRNYLYPLTLPPYLNYCSFKPFYGEIFHSDKAVNTVEFALFYVIKNVFSNFRINFENISNVSTQMIIDNEIQIKTYFSITNFILLLLSIFVLIFIFVEIKILESNIKESIEKILSLEIKKFIKLSIKLEKFIQFLKDFNKVNLEIFEKNKRNKMQIDNQEFNQQVETINTTKKQDEHKDPENSVINVENLSIGKSSNIILLFGFIFYLSITVAQLVLRSTQLSNIVSANKISISILRRFSDLVELDLFYKLAVIQNDPYYITVTQADYDALSALGIYDQFDPNKDELYQEAFNSYFSYVYFKTTQDIQNIDDYMLNYKSTSFMNNTRGQEIMLSDSNFCVEISNFFFKYISTCSIAGTCASLNATSVEQCEIPVNSNGFQPGLTAILTNLKNYYLDFLKSWKSNPGQIEVSKFIYNHDILSGSMNIDGVYKKIHSNVIYTINEDMINLYNRARSIESMFTFIQISFDFCFLAFIILVVFMKLKKHSNTLKKFFENIEKITIIKFN